MIANIEDLITFLHEFHAPWGEHPSLSSLPDDLPRPLTRLYDEFGKLIDMESSSHRLPFATQDALVSSDRLKHIKGMCEFAWENQGNWSCRFPLGMSDPPVYSDAPDLWESRPKGFVKVCDSLEHFLITLSLQEAVMSCPNLFVPRGHDSLAIFTSKPIPLWQNGIYIYKEPSHNFFTIHGSRMLIMMEHNGIWMGSHQNDIEPHISEGVALREIS